METIKQLFDINTTFFTIRGYDMSYLEFFGTVFNILCVRLASRNKIINRPIGILGVLLYIFLFYQIQLYADLIEQFYFLITSFYGRWAWSTHKQAKEGSNQQTTLQIQQTTKKENLIYLGVGIFLSFLLMYIIQYLSLRFPNLFPEPASYPFLDAFTTVLSFLATILMARRKVACRYLRILVDIIGIWLYYVKGVKFIALEYVVFFVLASLGLIKWLQLLKQQKKADQQSSPESRDQQSMLQETITVQATDTV